MPIDKKVIATVYWNSGEYYLGCEPERWHSTEASMYRRADELGFTHVKVFHGWYSAKSRSFEINQVPPRLNMIPKKYRSEVANA